MKSIRLLLIAVCLFPVLSIQAQESSTNGYRDNCTTDKTNLLSAAMLFEVTLDDMEYVNASRDVYREPYLIRPNCFFTIVMDTPPLYVESNPDYMFMLDVVEPDMGFGQITPEGYRRVDRGIPGLHLQDLTYIHDSDGNVVGTGIAVPEGEEPSRGTAMALSGRGLAIGPEANLVGMTFLNTVLDPNGTIVTVAAVYDEGSATPRATHLSAFRYAGGASLWKSPLFETPLDLRLSLRHTFILVQPSQVSVREVETAEVLWSEPRTNALATSVHDKLYIWGEGHLTNYDLRTGRVNWDVPTPDVVYSELITLYNGFIAVADDHLATYHSYDGVLSMTTRATPGLSTIDVACEVERGCWRIAAGDEGIVLEHYEMGFGSRTERIPLPGETVDSNLKVRVEDNGWVIVTGQNIHARTPRLSERW